MRRLQKTSFTLGWMLGLAMTTVVVRGGAQATNISTSATLPTNCTVGNVYVKTGGSAGFYVCLATDTWTAVGGGGGSSALSSLTAASAANTLANGNNHSQEWNWALTSNSVSALSLGETTAATGGTSDNQPILTVGTLATSTAIPLYVKNYGSTDAFRVDDVSGDTTPFVIDASGNVGIGQATPGSYGLNVAASGSFVMLASGNAKTFQWYTGGTNADFGTSTNHGLGIFTNGGNDQAVFESSKVLLITRNSNGTSGRDGNYLQLGGNDSSDSIRIGMGYCGGCTNTPAYMSAELNSGLGSTKYDLAFFTRDVTTDSAPSERMRVLASGAVTVQDLKTTGSAGSKKVVCVDTATGQLYASSTGTDCSN